jgi:hypothetical protein
MRNKHTLTNQLQPPTNTIQAARTESERQHVGYPAELQKDDAHPSRENEGTKEER